jgi:predicted TIM-barrel fold metal-dependent hydrolase
MAMTHEDMSARNIDADAKAAASKIPDFIVSADSHVYEPHDLWDRLHTEIKSHITPPKRDLEDRPKGGRDPKARIVDMDLDGIAAEILYPTFGLRLFDADQDVQEAAFRTYNDWLAEYCRTSPKRLFGVPCLAVYDIDVAVKEMQRCHDMGLMGGLVWEVPDPRLPLKSDHYDRLWAAAVELGYPINFHILTGHTYKNSQRTGMDKIFGSVNIKTMDAMTLVFDLVWSGVFTRHPKLKVEIVESEIGWMPFLLQQWDYYYERYIKLGTRKEPLLIKELPSKVFKDHIYATFMDDFVGAQLLRFWGDRNCMWSSDYPHLNMTWPNSRAFIGKQIGDLDRGKQTRVLSQNVIDLYKLQITSG